MALDDQHLMASLDLDDPNHFALLALRMGRGSSANGGLRSSGEARGVGAAVAAAAYATAARSSSSYTEGQPSAREGGLLGGPRGTSGKQLAAQQGQQQQQGHHEDEDHGDQQLMKAVYGAAHPHRLHHSSKALTTDRQQG